jgi:RimJ/RimL family protein N-acetyltransferase
MHAAILESRQELFAQDFIPSPDFSMEDLDAWTTAQADLWENDQQYFFQIIQSSTSQVLGMAFLNHITRHYQMANLGYWVRTSRVGEGIATEAAKLVARSAFEQFGFQRLEIVVGVNNLSSLKVADKIAAVREGLLRNRLYLHGSPVDAYMHSLIPADYGIYKTA